MSFTQAALGGGIEEIEGAQQEVLAAAPNDTEKRWHQMLTLRKSPGSMSGVARPSSRSRVQSSPADSRWPPPKNFDLNLVLVDVDPKIRPGMTAVARIATERIPEDALTIDGDFNLMFVLTPREHPSHVQMIHAHAIRRVSRPM